MSTSFTYEPWLASLRRNNHNQYKHDNHDDCDLVLFHKADIDSSASVRQGLRSSPWLSLPSPLGAGSGRP